MTAKDEDGLPLDRLYRAMREGRISARHMENELFRHILAHPRAYRAGRRNPDDFPDLVCAIYPRLSAAIGRYEERGTSFDAYISAIIKFAARDAALDERARRFAERAYWRERARDDADREDVSVDPRAECGTPPGRALSPRQTLIILLKSYHCAKDKHVEYAAARAGLPAEQVYGFVEAMRTRRARADESGARLRERIATLFFRYVTLEERLRAEGARATPRLREAFERARHLLERARERHKRSRRGATNLDVAAVLGIPKGTVDSALFRARRLAQTGAAKPAGNR